MTESEEAEFRGPSSIRKPKPHPYFSSKDLGDSTRQMSAELTSAWLYSPWVNLEGGKVVSG